MLDFRLAMRKEILRTSRWALDGKDEKDYLHCGRLKKKEIDKKRDESMGGAL